MNNEKKFLEIRSKAEKDYKKLDHIFCPYLQENVNFNSKGLDHIKLKKWNKARSREDQFMRLKLLKLVPDVINNSHTLQGYLKKNSFERKKINSRWDNISTLTHYFEFIAIVKNVRIRVIVKQVEGGEKYFWSIVPFWRMNKTENKRLLFSGVPDED